MEPDPPDPHVPAVLLAAAARLGWRATSRDPSGVELGVLSDGTTDRAVIVISEGSLGTCAWSIVNAAPRGFAPAIMSRATYDVLHDGTSTTTGEVLYQGRAYRIRSYFDGCQQARAIAA